jgi:glutamate/tyrosine decarboxylase-like PLP-dependent enzyme
MSYAIFGNLGSVLLDPKFKQSKMGRLCHKERTYRQNAFSKVRLLLKKNEAEFIHINAASGGFVAPFAKPDLCSPDITWMTNLYGM